MQKNRVLVIGAGTAGKAAALFLAKAGWNVCLIDRRARPAPNAYHSFQVGESLPPKSRLLLQQLGVWEAFLAQGHLPSPGNRSFWSSLTETNSDFLMQVEQSGWHLDRIAFELLLLSEVEQLDIELHFSTNITDLKRCQQGWKVQFEQMPQKENHFSYLLDASGRNAWLARKSGVERLSAGWQLALVNLHEQAATDQDQRSLIEAVPQGWWYSAPIPRGRLVYNFFCRPDKTQRQEWLEADTLNRLLAQAPHTLRRLGKTLRAPRFVAADSTVLRQPFGHHWLAIGDAALTFDPIASHGISFALLSARDASHCLQALEKGDRKAYLRYHQRLWSSYDYYLREKTRLYASVKRFGESPYWKRLKHTKLTNI